MANHLCVHLYDLAPDRRPALPVRPAPRCGHLSSRGRTPHPHAGALLDRDGRLRRGARVERTHLRRTAEARRNACRRPARAIDTCKHDIMVGYSRSDDAGKLRHRPPVVATRERRVRTRVSMRSRRCASAVTHSLRRARSAYGDPSVHGVWPLCISDHTAEATAAAAHLRAGIDAGILSAVFTFAHSRIRAAITATRERLIAQAAENQAGSYSGELIPSIPAGEALGFFQLRHGENATAIAAFTQTLAAYPNDPRALYGLATALTASRTGSRPHSARDRVSTVCGRAPTQRWPAPTSPEVRPFHRFAGCAPPLPAHRSSPRATSAMRMRVLETSSVCREACKPRAAGVFQGIVTANPDFAWNPKIHDSPHFIEDFAVKTGK